MSQLLMQLLNSLALAGLLFLLSSGFSLVFGLLKIPNMAHGSLYMLGAYVGYTSASVLKLPLEMSILVSGAVVAVVGILVERLLLRRIAGNEIAQVLATLGIAFVISHACQLIWGATPLQVSPPDALKGAIEVAGLYFPAYRVFLFGVAVVVALALWLIQDHTRIGAMIRASVDDPDMARAIGIPVSALFTAVFGTAAVLVGIGGALGAPILSPYPGLDMETLPFALIVVILGGIGSLLGAFAGSIIVGLLYTLGQSYFADLAYVILFLPMVLALLVRPQGLFGRVTVFQLAAPIVVPSDEGIRSGPGWRVAAIALLAAATVVALAPPSNYYLNFLTQILIFAIGASAMNLMMGYGGLISLAHPALFGVSAYATALLFVKGGMSHGAAIALSLSATTALAGAMGALALRATGLSFMMITLALGQTLWGLAFRWVSMTDGENGVSGLSRPQPFGLDASDPRAYFLIVLVAYVLVYLAVRMFIRSSLGASLQGTRDQPRRMSALGFDVWRTRWIAFTFSGFVAALGGILYVYFEKFISPHALALPEAAELLLMVVAGGVGTLLGPLVGAALVLLFKQIVSSYVTWWPMLLGGMFVLIVLFMPQGIVPGVARIFSSRPIRKKTTSVEQL